MAAVIRTSQLRSLICSSKSAVAKYLMLLAAGFANGFNNLDTTSAGMSWGWQLRTHATCSAVRRAGNCPRSVKKRYCSVFVSKPFVHLDAVWRFQVHHRLTISVRPLAPSQPPSRTFSRVNHYHPNRPSCVFVNG